MKPEHFCSGNLAVEDFARVHFGASMKPEHFCSGNCATWLNARDWNDSFNEAGAFLLRKRNGAWRPPTGCFRFNEAGAFLLRKPNGCRCGGLRCCRFNEAGAFLLRKRRDAQRFS